MSRLLITGASGFVGAHVARAAVERGHEVTLLLREGSSLERLEAVAGRCRVVRARLGEPGAWLDELGAPAPACIHLAWYAEPGKYLESLENLENLADTMRLLSALASRGCPRFVGAGTCAEYDTDAGYLREDGATRPATLYAATKLSAATTGLRWAATTGIPFVWGRVFYLYGPQEPPGRLVSELCRSLLGGRPFRASHGAQFRDYLHVRDVAEAFVTLATAEGASGVYNIASGEPVRVRQLMQTAAELTGRGDLLELGALPARPWDPPFICGESARLRGLGWAPRFDLREGLADTLAWWKQRESVNHAV